MFLHIHDSAGASPLLLNTDRILSIKPEGPSNAGAEAGALITLVNSDCIFTVESFNEIAQQFLLHGQISLTPATGLTRAPGAYSYEAASGRGHC